jgi:glutamine synthetase
MKQNAGTKPYLLLAALFTSGERGVEDELELGPLIDENAGGYDPSAESARFDSRPRDLDDALDARR